MPSSNAIHIVTDLRIHERDAEGPTWWTPKIPKEAALQLIDAQIQELSQRLAQAERARQLIADCERW